MERPISDVASVVNDIFTFVMAVSTMMLPPPVSGVNASSRFPSRTKAGIQHYVAHGRSDSLRTDISPHWFRHELPLSDRKAVGFLCPVFESTI